MGAVDECGDLGAVGGLSDDLDVVGAAQHEGEAGADEGVVVYEEHADSCHGRYVIMHPGAVAQGCQRGARGRPVRSTP
ncbi:hypothetical protein GCM10010243_26630 [Streptomyces matensis]|nr:hypothetical protein GCM10010243_26630 [Streptomyces matensis]